MSLPSTNRASGMVVAAPPRRPKLPLVGKALLSAALSVLLVVHFSTAPAVLALQPALTPSHSYSGSRYHTSLCAVELTGNPRTDIVNVALSQVGYHESSSAEDLSGSSNSGGNCTEYGRSFGTVKDSWCAMFVWWCAAQVGISEKVIPHTEWAKVLTYGCPCTPFGNASPQAGDLAFIDSNGDGLEDHIGIVTQAGDTITTVEGNSGDAVKVREYSASVGKATTGSSAIIYIGKPDYDNNGASHNSTEQYVTITGRSVNARSTPSMSGTIKKSFKKGQTYLLLTVYNNGGEVWFQVADGLDSYWVSSTVATLPTTTTTTAITTSTAPSSASLTEHAETNILPNDPSQEYADEAEYVQSETPLQQEGPIPQVQDGYTQSSTYIELMPSKESSWIVYAVASAVLLLLVGCVLAVIKPSRRKR